MSPLQNPLLCSSTELCCRLPRRPGSWTSWAWRGWGRDTSPSCWTGCRTPGTPTTQRTGRASQEAGASGLSPGFSIYTLPIAHSVVRTDRNSAKFGKKNFFVLEWFGTSFQTFFLQLNGLERNSEYFSLLRNGLEWNPKFFYLTRNSWKRNYEVLRLFLFYEMVRNGIPSILIFCGFVRFEITKFRVFFSSKKRFGTVFLAFLSSAEGLGTEFRAFSVQRNRRNE